MFQQVVPTMFQQVVPTMFQRGVPTMFLLSKLNLKIITYNSSKTIHPSCVLRQSKNQLILSQHNIFCSQISYMFLPSDWSHVKTTVV
jgi:hypothetical protein